MAKFMGRRAFLGGSSLLMVFLSSQVLSQYDASPISFDDFKGFDNFSADESALTGVKSAAYSNNAGTPKKLDTISFDDFAGFDNFSAEEKALTGVEPAAKPYASSYRNKVEPKNSVDPISFDDFSDLDSFSVDEKMFQGITSISEPSYGNAIETGKNTDGSISGYAPGNDEVYLMDKYGNQKKVPCEPSGRYGFKNLDVGSYGDQSGVDYKVYSPKNKCYSDPLKLNYKKPYAYGGKFECADKPKKQRKPYGHSYAKKSYVKPSYAKPSYTKPSIKNRYSSKKNIKSSTYHYGPQINNYFSFTPAYSGYGVLRRSYMARRGYNYTQAKPNYYAKPSYYGYSRPKPAYYGYTRPKPAYYGFGKGVYRPQPAPVYQAPKAYRSSAYYSPKSESPYRTKRVYRPLQRTPYTSRYQDVGLSSFSGAQASLSNRVASGSSSSAKSSPQSTQTFVPTFNPSFNPNISIQSNPVNINQNTSTNTNTSTNNNSLVNTSSNTNKNDNGLRNDNKVKF